MISGYKRLRTVRTIDGELSLPGYETIRAVVRDPAKIGGTIVAMVEENEIRAQLSPYECDRIAVTAAQDGAVENAEAAVAALFADASKGKRSKIRSFAMIHEELGDLLEYGDRMTERDGLRLAGMLRQGGEARLRAALEDGAGETFEDEWAANEPVLWAHERALADCGGAGEASTRSGAKRVRGHRDDGTGTGEVKTPSSSIRLEKQNISGGYALWITGPGADRGIMDALMRQVRYLPEKP